MKPEAFQLRTGEQKLSMSSGTLVADPKQHFNERLRHVVSVAIVDCDEMKVLGKWDPTFDDVSHCSIDFESRARWEQRCSAIKIYGVEYQQEQAVVPTNAVQSRNHC